MSSFPPGTPAADILERLGSLTGAPRPSGEAHGAPGDGTPFLSVLVRTQGGRPATLEDTLLTLAGQTCDDFEVLVLVHDAPDGALAAIEHAVGEHHRSFACRVRVLGVQGGGRSRPLNEGARVACGRYLAMLDDDDIAFAHWVESFKAAADRAPGQVLRSCVATQDVRVLPGDWDGTDGYEVVGRPRVDYPLVFDYLDHLVDNRTPNNGYAVPRAAVCDLGLTWDESLPVLEDWDHLMRAASVCGVESCPTVSALLRSWSEGSSSKTAHSEEIWTTVHRRIEERHTSAPVLLQAGTAARLRARAARDEAPERERMRLAAEVQRLQQVLRVLTANLEEAGRRLEAVDVDVLALREALRDAQSQLEAMRSSTTWRLGMAARAPVAVARRVAAALRRSRTSAQEPDTPAPAG